MNDCVFCRFFQPGAKLPEDWLPHYTSRDFPRVASFIPLNPVTPGHRLFVPDEHMFDASDSPFITGKVFEMAANYASRHASNYNLIVNSGPAATQSVFHLHVHFVPRRKDDGLALPWYSGKGNH